MSGKWLLSIVALCSTGCAGPERGFLGEFRGRSQVLYDLEDDGKSRDADPSRAPLFPLLYVEKSSDGFFADTLWPFLEWGHGPEALGANPSRYFRLRPIFYVDSFRGYSRFVIFPIYFHVREELEAGNRSIDHFWPLYGIHREWIDLEPAVTHHFLFPFISFRHGWNRWAINIFPAFAYSHGYIDRGWWLLPVIKYGSHGLNGFFYLLDPVFAYERDSIAESAELERPEQLRQGWRVLGGLFGWETDQGHSHLRLFWFRIGID